MKIAFYAPIKPPDHPIPSGDRLIAGNLIKAMRLAGNDVHLASRYIAYSKRSDVEILVARRQGALVEAAMLINKYQTMPKHEQPELWVTYHPYCKAPDWIGPRIADALAIPYVTIEAARTGQGDQWQEWRAEAQKGIRQANRNIWFKPTDRDYLTKLLGGNETLCHMPPFIDLAGRGKAAPAPLPLHWNTSTPVLITVGMMRKGKKDRNFFMLAEILEPMQQEPWNLIIVGGGPEEKAVKEAFSGISPERIHWSGEVNSDNVATWMRAAEIFVWPGWREPIGMVYLEAALQGLPSVAFDNMGVPLVVRHGETGLLAPLDDQDTYRKNLKDLLNDTERAANMGANASRFVEQRRSLEAAIPQLGKCLTISQ